MSLEATIQAEDCSRPEQLGPASPAARSADGALAPACEEEEEEEALMIQRLVLEEQLWVL